MSEFLLSDREQVIVDLLSNWKEGGNKRQIKVWLDKLEPWSIAELRIGVERCISDPNRTFCPKGVAEFIRYLPKPASQMMETSHIRPQWDIRGDWSGDWSKINDKAVLAVACIMRRNESAFAGRQAEFYALARSRGFSMDLIDEGARKVDVSIVDAAWLDQAAKQVEPR